MNAPALLALLAGGAFGFLVHRRHGRALPGGRHFVLRLNGALQAGVGVTCALLALSRVIGVAADLPVLGLEGEQGEWVRLIAGIVLATTIPLVIVHLLEVGYMWTLKNRTAVSELGIAILAWSIGALGVAGLELGPGFVPGLDNG